jgi:hypothetical protein
MPVPKYTNDRRGFEWLRQSMYILNSDQFAPITAIRYSIVNGIQIAAYCFTVGGAKIHSFEFKGRRDFKLCIFHPFLHSSLLIKYDQCVVAKRPLSPYTTFNLSLSVLSHLFPLLPPSSRYQSVCTTLIVWAKFTTYHIVLFLH